MKKEITRMSSLKIESISIRVDALGGVEIFSQIHKETPGINNYIYKILRIALLDTTGILRKIFIIQ